MNRQYISVEYDRSHLSILTSFPYSLANSSVDIYDIVITFANVVILIIILSNYIKNKLSKKKPRLIVVQLAQKNSQIPFFSTIKPGKKNSKTNRESRQNKDIKDPIKDHHSKQLQLRCAKCQDQYTTVISQKNVLNLLN